MFSRVTATFLTRCLLLGTLMTGLCNASTCTKGAVGLRLEFNCPLPMMDGSSSYCCGPADNQYCCTLGEFIKDFGVGALVGIGIAAVVVIALIIWAICCCCGCCACCC